MYKDLMKNIEIRLTNELKETVANRDTILSLSSSLKDLTIASFVEELKAGKISLIPGARTGEWRFHQK